PIQGSGDSAAPVSRPRRCDRARHRVLSGNRAPLRRSSAETGPITVVGPVSSRTSNGDTPAGYPVVMPGPEGFAYVLRGQDVVITHHGRTAATLRGPRAAAFLVDVERDDPQELMARLTGNYR